MATNISDIDTIVIVMMENRSFDHMYGYLSTAGYNRTEVEGLRMGYSNSCGNVSYPTFKAMGPNIKLAADPPHERSSISLQLGVPAGWIYPMNGFVENLSSVLKDFGKLPFVMGYWNHMEVPTSHFFSEEYAICDHWFSAIPAGTQPNRLMAMAGCSSIDVNKHLLPDQDLVYDWLTRLGIRWRVYHCGLPFFALMTKMWPAIVEGENFRSIDRLAPDIKGEDDATFPQVIFIEPRYTDAPHIEPANDDHAPSPVTNGQYFLGAVYRSLIANISRWKKTAMFITYDEHGGFFDHVSPPRITTMPPPGFGYQKFESLGVRVPGIVVSPFVEKRAVYSEILDHTSILKLLGEKFNAGSYSDIVNDRPVGSASKVLTRTVARDENFAIPPDVAIAPALTGFVPSAQPVGPTAIGFKQAIHQMKINHPAKMAQAFGNITDHFS